jgi:hypothetical protein
LVRLYSGMPKQERECGIRQGNNVDGSSSRLTYFNGYLGQVKYSNIPIYSINISNTLRIR